MNTSVKKIANELGVSVATVSMVLNHKSKGRVSFAMEKRILEFCNTQNYVPNIHAQRMNSQFSGIIAVVFASDCAIDSFGNEGAYSELLADLVDATEKKGLHCVVMSMSPKLTETNILQMFLSRGIDGLIFFGKPTLPLNWKSVIIQHSLPTVCISCDPADGIPTVNVDNHQGIAMLCDHLREKGYEHLIGLGVDPSCGIVASERADALKEAAGSGLAELKLLPAYDETAAENWVMAHFGSQRPVQKTALVCLSDFLAFGALNGFRKLNLRVPEDIGVVSSDNFRICRYITPKLTCMDSRHKTMSDAAVDLLQCLIRAEKDMVKHVRVSPMLALRESC